MAEILTYNKLFSAIQDYVERTDSTFVSQIPLFIMLGQRRIARELKILPGKVFITDNLIVGQQIIKKPNNWLSSSTFNIGTSAGFNKRKQILERSYEFCRIYWPDPTEVEEPKYYSDYDFNNWLIVPTPNLPYPYEIAYFAVPVLIDETSQANWITENAPDLIIYACLLETASYLKDDERKAVWQSYYDNAKSALTNEDMSRIYDGFSKRGN